MSGITEEFRQAHLAKHNEYRAKHKVKPLTRSSQLDANAQAWAEHIAAKGQFMHSTPGTKPGRDKNSGENIHASWSSKPHKWPKAEEAVETWYAEIKDYNPDDSEQEMGNKFAKIGHFTQVVWEKSEKVGVGMAKTADGWCYVVAQYEPAGNLIGSFKQNVHM